MIEIIDTVDQGTEEWLNMRIGSIGGSSIDAVCAGGSGKTREALLYRMVGEILSGKKHEGFVSKDMENGTLWEPDARNLYALINNCEVRQVALIRNGPHKHESPDGLVGEDGSIEIKSVIPSTHVKTIVGGVVPSDNRKQIQWGLSISGREWRDFISYCPLIIERPIFIVRVTPDKKLIRELHDAADIFIEDMLKIVEKIRRG